MNRSLNLFSACILLMIVYLGFLPTSEIVDKNLDTKVKTKELKDIKILALIADNFGDTYFFVTDLLESWGCNITTAGLTDGIASCPLQPQRPITPDVIISEINENQITEYDCVFIPGGPHYQILASNAEVLNLVAIAYEKGLVVAAICSGNAVLANAHNIVNGTKVAYHSRTSSLMESAGGILFTEARVVADSRIVTGGFGGQGGHNAPSYQLCVAIVKEILEDYSYVLTTTIEPSSGTPGTNYTIKTETTNTLSELFTVGFSTEISKITANIYLQGNTTCVTTVELKDRDRDSIYSGSFTDLKPGDYHVDIEVTNFGQGLEVVRDVINFSVIVSVPGFKFSVIMIIIALLSFMVLKIRRKHKKQYL